VFKEKNLVDHCLFSSSCKQGCDDDEGSSIFPQTHVHSLHTNLNHPLALEKNKKKDVYNEGDPEEQRRSTSTIVIRFLQLLLEVLVCDASHSRVQNWRFLGIVFTTLFVFFFSRKLKIESQKQMESSVKNAARCFTCAVAQAGQS